MAGDRDKTRTQLFEDVKVLRQQVAEHEEQITKNQQFIDELKENERRYRLIAQNSHDWEFWLDVDDRLLYTSPSCKKITGYTEEEFKKNRDLLFKIIEPSDRSIFTEHRNMVKKSKVPGDEEFRIIRKDGKIRWISHVCQPVYDDDGQYAGTRASNRDITESKIIEDEVKERTRHLEILAENISDMIWTMDTDLNLTYVSPSVEQLRGFTVEEVLSQDLDEIFAPESLELANTVWGEELALEYSKKAPLNRSRMVQLEYLCKDGSTIWTETNLTPIRDISGKMIEILGVSRNISDRKMNGEDSQHSQIEKQGIETLLREQANQTQLMMKKLQDSEKLVQGKDAFIKQNEKRLMELEKLLKEKENQLKQIEQQRQDNVKQSRESEKLAQEKDSFIKQNEKRLLELEKLLKEKENQLKQIEQQRQDSVKQSHESEKLAREKDTLIQQNEKQLLEFEKLLKEKENQLKQSDLLLQDIRRKASESEKLAIDQENRLGLMEAKLLENNNLMRQNEKIKPADTTPENEECYQSLFENGHMAMLLIDPDRQSIVDANRVACAYYGWNREEMTQMKMSEISKVSVDELNAQMTLDPMQKRNYFISKHCRADGSIRNVEIFSGSLRRNGKKLLYNIINDITERNTMEESLQNTVKLQSLGLLAGGIVHDFNNLLTLVQGYLDMAVLGIKSDHIAQKWLKSAQQSLDKTRDLTSRLSAFSRGGQPKLKIQRVEHLLRDAVKSALKSSPVNPLVEIEKGLWPAEIDEVQIRQCFSNLADNARDIMPGGGTIRVRAENIDLKETDALPLADGPYLRIVFEDNGPGIPREHIEKIFDPYFSTKEAGQDKGMGLTVCNAVLKKHGGCITVDSGKNGGASFSLYLPAKPDGTPGADSGEKVFIPSRRRILIMDDSPEIRTLVQLYADQLDFDATTVAGGQEAIQEHQKAQDTGNPYCAVLMAFSVRQGLDGKAALTRIKKTGPDIKAIVISGYDDPVMKNFADYGFQAALKKPFRFEDVKKVLEETLT
jgi:PAS domain S-box-containing protein